MAHANPNEQAIRERKFPGFPIFRLRHLHSESAERQAPCHPAHSLPSTPTDRVLTLPRAPETRREVSRGAGFPGGTGRAIK